jgi:hypothetical protein
MKYILGFVKLGHPCVLRCSHPGLGNGYLNILPHLTTFHSSVCGETQTWGPGQSTPLTSVQRLLTDGICYWFLLAYVMGTWNNTCETNVLKDFPWLTRRGRFPL